MQLKVDIVVCTKPHVNLHFSNILWTACYFHTIKKACLANFHDQLRGTILLCEHHVDRHRSCPKIEVVDEDWIEDLEALVEAFGLNVDILYMFESNGLGAHGPTNWAQAFPKNWMANFKLVCIVNCYNKLSLIDIN